MTKTYQSRLGPELLITLSIMLGGPLLLMIYERNWPGVAIISACVLFVTHMIMTTYYQILGDQLNIKSGLVFKKTIDINTIKKVVATRNIISAPATSFDRLELVYNRYDSVIVSPGNKEGFIKDLLAVKADIDVKL